MYRAARENGTHYSPCQSDSSPAVVLHVLSISEWRLEMLSPTLLTLISPPGIISEYDFPVIAHPKSRLILLPMGKHVSQRSHGTIERCAVFVPVRDTSYDKLCTLALALL